MALERTRRGESLYRDGDHEAAIAAFREALELEPDLYHPMNLLGMALVDSGRVDEGIAVLHRGTTLYPTLERGYAALAYAHVKAGDRKKALSLLGAALSLATRQGHFQLARDIQQEIEKLQH